MVIPAPGPWPRPQYTPGGGVAEFEFFCFSTQDMPPDASFDLAGEGYPGSELPVGVGLRTDAEGQRGPEPLFDAFYRESLLVEHPGLEGDVDAIRFRHIVAGNVPDPADLTYLQAAWAAVRWFLRYGSFVVRDVRMEKWRTRAEVLGRPAAEPYQACGYRVQVEREAEEGWGHLLYTRGLSKFGRPDLIAIVAPELLEDAADALNAIAGGLAEGRRLPTSGQARDESPFACEHYVPGLNGPPREFFNEEVVLLRFDV
jgi:hypothetical protein